MAKQKKPAAAAAEKAEQKIEKKHWLAFIRRMKAVGALISSN